MTPAYLRALQAAILASPAASKLAITNDKGKVPSDEARAADQAVADIMRAEGFGAASRAVPAWQAKRQLIKRGKWRGIVLASADAEHLAVEAAYAAAAHAVAHGCDTRRTRLAGISPHGPGRSMTASKPMDAEMNQVIAR